MTPFTFLYALLASFCFTSVFASPVTRDVYAPPITYPTNGTIWAVGQKWNVTWNVSNPPKEITNEDGFITLRKGGLSTPLVLAYNFSILDGQHEITVPLVLNGSDYSLDLFGDSGDWSGNFTILSPVAI